MSEAGRVLLDPIVGCFQATLLPSVLTFVVPLAPPY